MHKNFRKALALTLALCSLLGLLLPAAPKVSAEDYPFPDIGEVTELGIVLKGNPNISGQAEIAEKDGRQYLGVPIKGGEFCVFALTDFLENKPNGNGNYLYDIVDSGIGVPRGVALDSKGNFYVTGDSSSVFYYNIHTGKSGKISTGASGTYAVAVDEKDNVYVAAKSGGAAVYQLDMGAKTARKIYTSADFTYANGIAAGGGKVYFQGPLTSAAGGGAQIRMLSASGELLASYNMPGSSGSYYVSYVDGVVFCGTSAKSTDGLVALDTAGNKLTKIDIGMNSPMLGVATKEYNGKSFIVVSGQGIYEYDVATRQLGSKVSGAGSRAMRAVNGYVKNGEDVLLLSVGPSSVATTKAFSGNTVSLTGLLEGAYTTYTPRSMSPGVPGTGVAVYVGAYLSGSVGSYTPGVEEPLQYPVFSNGHDQTDSMIVYNGKLYAGCYSGAYLVEYDPITGNVRELIPGLKDEYGQLRIHGLAAGDNKIFFSTIPKDQTLGGAIGWYDLIKDTWYCEPNVIQNQSVIALAYDEEQDILYGGTTIRGGTNATPKADQAVVFAYDVKEREVLDQTTVSKLTGDKPRNISGIAQDPASGKFFGLVSQTVFSLQYENGELAVTKEWAAATTPSDPYPDSGSLSWFPKAIQFDGNGGMYLGLNQEQYGIMKFTLDANGKIQRAETVVEKATRIYTLGADGNLYFYSDQLYKVSLDNRVSTVKILIDNADNQEAVAEARWAYNSLTQKEKEQLGDDYYQKLVRLENGDNRGVSETVDAINAIGRVTAASGPDIEKARELYDSLTATQKKNVFNAQILFDAEKAYAALSTPDEDAPVDPVESVMAAIDQIGEVTADSGPAIQKARVAYDNLISTQKLLVHNAQILFDAEQAYVAILTQTGNSGGNAPDAGGQPNAGEQPDADLAAVVLVKTQISAIGTVTENSGAAIQAAREAYDALTEEQKAQVPNAQVLFDAEKAYAALPSHTDSDDSDDSGSGAWIIILVVVLVLAAGAVTTVIMLKKRRAGDCSRRQTSAEETPGK